jgi:hypothetical protein
MNEVPFQKPKSIRAQRKTFSSPVALETVCVPLLQIILNTRLGGLEGDGK